MRKTEKNNPVKTIPEGVWESSRTVKDKNKTPASVSTDAQGNGYPDKESK